MLVAAIISHKTYGKDGHNMKWKINKAQGDCCSIF